MWESSSALWVIAIAGLALSVSCQLQMIASSFRASASATTTTVSVSSCCCCKKEPPEQQEDPDTMLERADEMWVSEANPPPPKLGVGTWWNRWKPEESNP